MAKKEIKLNIKNKQIAEAIQLGKLKQKLAKKKADGSKEEEEPKKKGKAAPEAQPAPLETEEAPRRKARSKSVFEEPETPAKQEPETPPEVEKEPEEAQEPVPAEPRLPIEAEEGEEEPETEPVEAEAEPVEEQVKEAPKPEPKPAKERLGPTGRHVKDLLPPPRAKKEPTPKQAEGRERPGAPSKGPAAAQPAQQPEGKKKWVKGAKMREYQDLKPAKRTSAGKFDARDRMGLRQGDDDRRWRKRRPSKQSKQQREELTIRPSELKVRIPISIKDLASEMKLKASELIQKLFLQGVIATINDFLEDETTIQLLGEEFGCAITIDTSEEQRIRITDKSVRKEIAETDPEKLELRAPVVAFMGHVDHGKTSLIDFIRKSNMASGEAGAITQHIGAFKCHTDIGDIAILDTPGHEAFSAMRARGADVTDIVVLVIAGDEGVRAQTIEAIQHAQAAGVTLIVAVNKSDKPNFDIENVHRQLADHNLLPEAWGGEVITVKCSAVTGEGVPTLLEMLALQAEILELQANPDTRARGSVLESEMHKGLGTVATVLVLNGSLKLGDPLVFGETWGRVKTMQDEHGRKLETAGPSTPVEITGLNGLPEAGEEFIAVKSEQEAREIAEKRHMEKRQSSLMQKKAITAENLFQEAQGKEKKVLNIVLRSDVQGSLEALKVALEKIKSEKADVNVIFAGVGEISESDVQLAAASGAMILGFHVQVESHAESLIKQYGVDVRLHDVIYHAVDEVKGLMAELLDKVAKEEEKGKVEVRQTFKSSHLGTIAGCLVAEGSVHRNHHVRQIRGGKEIWRGTIQSLKRVKDDVREVQKGLECGIVLNGTNDIEPDDILETFEITYISQEL